MASIPCDVGVNSMMKRENRRNDYGITAGEHEHYGAPLYAFCILTALGANSSIISRRESLLCPAQLAPKLMDMLQINIYYKYIT